MFERNKVDNSQHQIGVAVEVTREDGAVDKGKLLIAVSSKVADVLNGPLQFLEFESYTGERTLIAKSAVRAVRVVQVSNAVNPLVRLRDAEFDPYRILGLEPGASWEQVRNAFLAASKTYHPDRYANVDLPAEVDEYMAAMARRINAAFAALETPHLAKREIARHRTAPVYTSGGK
jgi:hypothetical protein